MRPEVWRPRANPWAIAVVVALAAFMEVSVAAANQSHIASLYA